MRSKKRILINLKWAEVFPLLTRNQILLCLFRTMDSEMSQYTRKIYPNGMTERFKKDMDKLDTFNIQNMNVLDELNKNEIEHYFTIKKETLHLLLKHDMPSKDELLILFWVDQLYLKRNDQYRMNVRFKLSTVLKEIFKKAYNSSNKRQLFIKTIEKFKSLKYSNIGDCLIKSYELSNGYITLNLDIKKRKKGWYNKNQKFRKKK